jgi:hypothetical protein
MKPKTEILKKTRRITAVILVLMGQLRKKLWILILPIFRDEIANILTP